MKVIINFIKGFKLVRKSPQMILLLFIVNFSFSMILAIPMYHSLKDSLGRSETGDKMAEGFDYMWWEEFSDESTGLETTFTPSIIGKGAILNNLEDLVQMEFFNLPPVILITGFFYMILHTFLAGGILSIFLKETPKFSMKGFFSGSGTYFSRFFLLMLISWGFFFGVASFLGGGFTSILDNVRENAVSEIKPFYLRLFFSAIFFFFLLFIQMVFDYARIKTAVEDNRNVLKSTLGAFGFVFRHPGSSLGLYYLIFLVNIGITVIYILLKEFLSQSSWPGVLIAFFIQQLFIFAIIGLRCWLYSSQMELYRYMK